jgi:hypothetical protein
VIGVATVVWQLSKYPTSDTVEAWKKQAAESQRVVEVKMQEIEIQQVNQSRDIGEIKNAVKRTEDQQQKIDDKLDRLLRP